MVIGELKSFRITLESTDTGVLGYVYLREILSGQVAQTRTVSPGVNADYDAHGVLLGVEFLNAQLANAAMMRQLATQLNAPELGGIDLSELCKTAA